MPIIQHETSPMLGTASSDVRDSADEIVGPKIEAAEAKRHLDLGMANIGINYNPDIPGVWMVDEERPMKFGKGYLCPIVLGQTLVSRYRILSLLGWGGFAMVWLAIDLAPSSPDSPKYVALKVFRGTEKSSDEYSRNEELCMRKLMQDRQRDKPGRRNIVELFDAFDIESPNGIHRCLVLEVAGLDFAQLAELEVYNFDDAVYLFKQCVETVDYVHSMGMSHGDLDLSNFVLAMPDFSGFTETEVVGKLFSDPKKYMTKVHTHTRNTPPELISEAPASSSSDVWALGLIFWHLLTGRPLIPYFGTSSHGETPPYEGQKRFASLTRDERRDQITNILGAKLGYAFPGEEYIGAVLDVLLDALEPNPSDRPTAGALLSYHIFSLIGRE